MEQDTRIMELATAFTESAEKKGTRILSSARGIQEYIALTIAIAGYIRDNNPETPLALGNINNEYDLWYITDEPAPKAYGTDIRLKGHENEHFITAGATFCHASKIGVIDTDALDDDHRDIKYELTSENNIIYQEYRDGTGYHRTPDTKQLPDNEFALLIANYFAQDVQQSIDTARYEYFLD